MSNQDITNPADEIRKEEKYSIPSLPLPYDLETKEVLKQLNRANRKLAELKGVEVTAEDTISLVKNIGRLMAEYKNVIRPDFGSKYNHELLNGLFYHPYTKIDHVVANMQVSRQTASKYLDRIVALGLLKKEKMGKENYYINTRLMNLFIEFGQYKATEPAEVIESVHVNDITK